MAATVTNTRTITEQRLKQLVRAILEKVDVDPDDAAIVAEVLIAADLRAIEAHGVGCLPTYVKQLQNGEIATHPDVETIRETNTSLLVDAGNGLGHPVAARCMERIVAKAGAHGAAFGAVRSSNHYGIAGYYAMLGLEHDLVGMAATNTVRYGPPTYGRDAMLGTNPFAYAVPTGAEPPFVLDFATSTPARGHSEVSGRVAPSGAFLPLGGSGVDHGGHKGYGLGLLADIFCGVLSGGTFGSAMPLAGDAHVPGAISHWFAAFRVDGFRDVADFKRDMDSELRGFKQSAKAPGQARIFVAGEIEFEQTQRYRRDGIPLAVTVWDGLEALAAEVGVSSLGAAG